VTICVIVIGTGTTGVGRRYYAADEPKLANCVSGTVAGVGSPPGYGVRPAILMFHRRRHGARIHY
jgi:hypothetical protein